MKKAIEPSGRWWKRHIESNITSLPKGLVELIVNSIDSYKRKNSDLSYVLIKYNEGTRKCSVVDNAQGMDRKQLEKVAGDYGELTSGINTNSRVTGVFGVGLKEVCIRMGGAKIITIKDSFITEGEISLSQDGKPHYKTNFSRKVNQNERFSYNIPQNGTVVAFTVPKDLKIKTERLITQLEKYWTLRKVLQNNKYKIIFADERLRVKKQLRWLPIEQIQLVFSKEESIKYENESFRVKIDLFSLPNDNYNVYYQEAPLVLIYNEDAIAERSILPDIEKELKAEKIFGEVYVYGFENLLGSDQPVLSENREGLLRAHMFNKILCSTIRNPIQKYLKGLNKDERPNFNIDRVIAILNNIIKNELGKNEQQTPPRSFRPINDILGFYYSSSVLKMKEVEEKSVFLVANTSILKTDVDIEIENNEIVEVEPSKINIKKFKSRANLQEDLRYVKIKIKAKKQGATTIIAKVEGFVDRFIINVEENKKLKVEKIEFIPDEQDIAHGKKRVALGLYVNSKILEETIEDINLRSSNTSLDVIKNLSVASLKEYGDDTGILEAKINLNISKDAQVNDNANITANYYNNEAIVKITIVDPSTKLFKGLFTSIRKTKKDTDEISWLSDGILYVNIQHPVLATYISNNGEQDISYLLMFADVVARSFCNLLALEKFNKNKLAISDINQPKVVLSGIENEYNRLYKMYGIQ